MDTVAEIRGYQVERYLPDLGEWWDINPTGPHHTDQRAAQDAMRASVAGYTYRIVEVITTRRTVAETTL